MHSRILQIYHTSQLLNVFLNTLYVIENTLLNLIVFNSKNHLKKSWYIPEIKQNIIIIKCTSCTSLETCFFPHCDGSMIQNLTFVWKIPKHESAHKLPLHLEHWNLEGVHLCFAAHTTLQVLSCNWPCSICQASSTVIWLSCGFDLLLGWI
jgi:hypothetical protein